MSSDRTLNENVPTRASEDVESEPFHEDENTPLLPREGASAQHDDRSLPHLSAVSFLRSINGSNSEKRSLLRRWPSALALATLCVAVVIILVLGFVTPHIAKEYASQAAQFEPTRLSIDSYTDTGVVARLEGHFTMDASKVTKKNVRDLGRFGSRLARYVKIGDTNVEISLPKYSGIILGTATVPSTEICIMNGCETAIDTLVNLQPGPQEDLRQLANDWVDGRFDEYVVEAKADVSLTSGFLRLGKHSISQVIALGADDIPTLPRYKIKRLNFHEMQSHNSYKGLAADVSIRVENMYPLDVQIPPLGFAIGVDNCLPSDPHIPLADALTRATHVQPKRDVWINVTSFVQQLPEAFLNTCPGTIDSPFDTLLGKYIHGHEATLYVSGSESPSSSTPQWISDLAYGVTVPVSFPGRSLGNLMKNFTMTDVHFSLPDFFADPNTPESQPKISAQIKALIDLPDEMNFQVDVHRIRSTADVFYHKKKLGVLDISKWHQANSKEIKEPNVSHPDLEITSHIEKAPLSITNQRVFNEVVRALLSGSSNVNLSVKALVDVQMETPLGELAVREIPAKGEVPVKPIGGSSLSSFSPTLGHLKVVETTPKSLMLSAAVNFTNPTNYTAEIPYADINILVNGTVLGHGSIRNVLVGRGDNTNIPVQAVWEPSKSNGSVGGSVGRELLSQYISGYNTTLTFKAYEGTIPSQPWLGRALQSLEIRIPTPRLGSPQEPGEGGGTEQPHFIKEATMHLISSTANFILTSPLTHTTIHLTHINATAFYHADAVGQICYDGDLEVPPGESETPKLPIEWSPGSVGYDAIKSALGGTLRLKAIAHVGVRIGQFQERIWYRGRSIGAKVRL